MKKPLNQIKKITKKKYKTTVKFAKSLTKKIKKVPSRIYKGAIAGAVIVSILASFFFGGNVQAATYIFSQNSWAGGVSPTTATHSGNQEGWNKYSALSGAAVSGDGASASLAPASASVTETFGTTIFEDGVNTTASWNTSTGQLGMQTATGVNLPAVTAAIGTSGTKMALDTTNNVIYIINISGNRNFWKYDISTGNITNLSSLISSVVYGLKSIAFDPGTNSVFIGGVIGWDDGCCDSGTNPMVLKYSVAQNQVSIIYGSTTEGYYSGNEVATLAVDAPHSTLYFGDWGLSRTFGKINLGNNTFTDLTSKISSFWGGNSVMSLVVNPSGVIYVAGSNGKFAQYSPSSNTASDLTSKISSFWGTNVIYALATDSSGAVYLGGTAGKFAKYIPSSNTASDLISTTSSFWSTNTINALAFDSVGENMYLGGSNGKLAKYEIAGAVATNVSTSISSFWLTSEIFSLLYSPSGNLYITGANGKVGYLSPGCSTCYGYSTAVDATTQNIISATLTKNDTTGTGTAVYSLSNDGGTTWAQVTPGVSHTFATLGSDLRFKVGLTGNASVQDVSISYNYYPSSGTLTGSVYDTEDAGNVMGGISWAEDATLPAGTGVTVGLRTAGSVEGVALASWINLTSATSGCTKSDTIVTCDSSAIPLSMRAGGDDRYFQYQITLTSNGISTPTVSGIEVTYVVNARPQFDTAYPNPETPGSGAVASQVVLEGSENLGKVFIEYSVRDTDSPLGTTTPGYVTPSFEYNIGGGWVAINPTFLRDGDIDNKSVDTASYREYSALWDAFSQIPGQYSSNAKIRVTINDNEGANNTSTAETPAFVLDTAPPAISNFTINASTNTITLAGTDQTNISYRLANSADYSDAGEWVNSGTNVLNASITDWTLAGAPGPETVYVEIKDENGNRAVSSAVAPASVQNLDLRDVGNNQTGEYREFLAWGLYAPAPGAQFASYEVYRSSNSTDYALLTTITDINQNYYTDSALSPNATYSYKIVVTDEDGEKSKYSTIVSDTPDGQGGTDFTAPEITNVSVTALQTTWVKITWTTDELSDSVVEYSVSPNTTFTSSKSSTAIVREHELVVDGLVPNTEYLFRVKSTDILDNVAVDDNGGAGYDFDTAGGPEISGVAVRSVDDNTATIVWNTDRSANSYVVYGVEPADLEEGDSVQTVGSAEFVPEPFEHEVLITTLMPKTTYYFYVKSADAETGYESIDNRSGRYYTFNTTHDQKAPTISNIQAPIITPTAASITWTTDELADSVVEYGTAEGSYTESSSRDTTKSIYHVMSLNGLEPQTQYYIRVKSTDSAGNESEATSSFETVSQYTVIFSGSTGGSGTEIDTLAPRISGATVKNETSFGATIAFETDENTVGFVNFGEDTQYGKSIGDSALNTSHEIKLFGLKSGTNYSYEIKVFDAAGNMAALPNKTFTTKFISETVDELVILQNMEEFQSKLEGLIESTLPSLIPPVINEIEVTNVSDTGADVSWKTNVKAFGTVALVKGDEFDPTVENPYKFEMSNVEEKVKDHKLSVQSLEPGTKYHFQVKAFSIPGVIGKSKDYNFATRAMNAKVGAIKATNNSFTLSWQTADATTSFVEYKNLKTGKVAEMGNKDLTKNHIVEVGNLPGATSFEATYYGYTSDGVKIEGSPMRVTTLIDNKAPIISDVSISSAFIPYRPNQLQTLISWKTDEPASSIVEYEEGPGSAETLAHKTGGEEEFTKDHIVILPGFKPGTIYRVRITSGDSAGNTGVVPTRTIITPVASDTVFEIIINNFEDVFGFLKNVR